MNGVMAEQPYRFEACRATGAFHVEECDVPVDMTLGEWRLHCAEQRRACDATAPRRGAVRRSLRRILGS
jgi:hypothetical protein